MFLHNNPYKTLEEYSKFDNLIIYLKIHLYIILCMNYTEWFELHKHHLYEIYNHIILPAKNNLPLKYQSTVSYQEFCNTAYHGSRMA